MPDSKPLISVVIATYNRSNVLRWTLESLRGQTVRDWEALVIGDACTDDTGDLVASLGDPRIRFHDLEENFGEQSHPNNVGTEMARGRYLAYLNQDDLWFPDHLEISLALIEKVRADLVFGPNLIAKESSPEALERDEWRFDIDAPPGDMHYRPYIHAPASTWLLRRELIGELGGWRPAVRVWGVPSQDLLFRAWRAQQHLCCTQRITMLSFPSLFRKGSYAGRHDYEQAYFFPRLREPGFRAEAIERTALQLSAHGAWRRNEVTSTNLVRPTLVRLLVWLGIVPQALWHWSAFGLARRHLIEKARRTRGLSNAPRGGWRKGVSAGR